VQTTTAARPSHATALPIRSLSLSMPKARRRSARIPDSPRGLWFFRAVVSTIGWQNAI